MTGEGFDGHFWSRGTQSRQAEVRRKYPTKSIARGVIVATKNALAPTPSDKVLKAQIVLSRPIFDPGVTMIPINSLPKLRGRGVILEFVLPEHSYSTFGLGHVISSQSGYSVSGWKMRRYAYLSTNYGGRSDSYVLFFVPHGSLMLHFVELRYSRRFSPNNFRFARPPQ